VKGLHGEFGTPGNFWAEAENSTRFSDPFGLFRQRQAEPQARISRPVGNMERKAFLALNLEITATSQEIKLRYKQMVKRFHPDANGGDKAFEEKLRDIIQAYAQLKTSGFC
jgi:DnaJ-domain-containing protein 1